MEERTLAEQAQHIIDEWWNGPDGVRLNVVVAAALRDAERRGLERAAQIAADVEDAEGIGAQVAVMIRAAAAAEEG
jgi:hypothetical protein